MKKVCFSVLAILSFVYAQAQVSGATLVTMNMSQGNQKGFKILVPEANEKEVQKAWEKYLKGFDGKSSNIQKSDDIITERVLMPSISDTAIVLYSNFNETPQGVYLNVFVLADGRYISPSDNDKKSDKFSGILKTFATQLASEIVNERLEDAKKELDKLEKDQRNLEKDLSGYEKEIKRAKETIAANEKNIEQNSKDQEKKKSEIVEQKKAVNKVKEDLLKYPVK